MKISGSREDLPKAAGLAVFCSLAVWPGCSFQLNLEELTVYRFWGALVHSCRDRTQPAREKKKKEKMKNAVAKLVSYLALILSKTAENRFLVSRM
ncbi:MAG: hypothetical protein WC952_14380 [Desulfobulbaceae bacterium]